MHPPTPPSAPRLALSVLPGTLAVCRLDAALPLPDWAMQGGAFVSITRSPDELSVVCAEARVPDGIPREGGWRCLKVAGPLAFSLTGVLAALTAPLAAARISVFATSTYDTDYLMVKAGDLDAAVAALKRAGHAVSVL